MAQSVEIELVGGPLDGWREIPHFDVNVGSYVNFRSSTDGSWWMYQKSDRRDSQGRTLYDYCCKASMMAPKDQ